MNVANVYEWLIAYAGSERVVEQLLKIHPEADRAFLGGRRYKPPLRAY